MSFYNLKKKYRGKKFISINPIINEKEKHTKMCLINVRYKMLRGEKIDDWSISFPQRSSFYDTLRDKNVRKNVF